MLTIITLRLCKVVREVWAFPSLGYTTVKERICLMRPYALDEARSIVPIIMENRVYPVSPFRDFLVFCLGGKDSETDSMAPAS